MAIDAIEMNTFLDTRHKKFYLCDVEPFGGINYENADNGLSGMAAVCILAHEHYLLDKLDSLEKKKAKNATRTILNKVLTASRKKGLSYSNQTAAQDNVEYISDTLDKLDFSEKEKKHFLNDLLVGSICPNQILGYLSIRNEK